MEHFINIIYKENADSHGIAECIASGSNILTESSIDFYTGELDTNEKIITMALPEAVKDIDSAAQDIAMRLFEFGLKDFDIEITEDETIARTLRRGMRGEDVKRIQREIGMPAAEQDGIYGPKTERAVRAFQQKAGIQVDGIVGQQTQSAILKTRMPNQNIAVQKPGAAYIDAPYPQQDAKRNIEPGPSGPSADVKPKPRPKTPPNIRPELRPQPQGDLAQLPRTATPPERPVGQLPGTLDQKGQTPPGVEPKPEGAYKVITGSGQGTRYRVYDADGTEIRNGRGKGPTNIPTQQQYQDRINPDANDPRAGNADSGFRAPPKVTTQQQADSIFQNPDATPAEIQAAREFYGADSTSDEQPDAMTTAPTMGQNDTSSGNLGFGTSGAGDQANAQTLGKIRQDTLPKAANKGKVATVAQEPPAATGEVKGPYSVKQKMGPGGTISAFYVVDGNGNTVETYDVKNRSQIKRQRRVAANVAKKMNKTEESVAPRPKGAFMFKERNEWNANYRNTHNIDGTPKQLTESIEDYQVTYEDDDKFYEDYGVMWYNEDEVVDEAEYQGRKVKLGKPMAGDVKKFKVYVKNPKGNVVKVNFGQKGVKIKKDNPNRRRSFRARHNCDNPGPRHKARYWSCRKW
jgi:peptidoglycan hydrolase-like protein with peptidoglycan-binding domain